MNELSTELTKKQKILDTAEVLFSEGGYDGVSLRNIAHASGVGLPLISYHFKTKLNLYRSLFERRKSLFDERLRLLHSKNLEDCDDPLDHLVRSFVSPVIESQKSLSGFAYARLVAREVSDPKETERGIVKEFFDPFADEFINAIFKCLPQISEENAYWSYMFAVGVLIMNVFDHRIERISKGKFKNTDFNKKTEYLISFIKAGILANN